MEGPRFSEMKLWFLGTFGIITSAMKIPFRNPNFITLALITSFPLFCKTLIPKLSFNQPIAVSYKHTHNSNSLTSDMFWYLYQTLYFLKAYLVDLVNFFTAFTTVYAASAIYTSTQTFTLSLRDLLRNSVMKTRWREPVITFFSVSLSYSFCSDTVYYLNHGSRFISSSYEDRFLQALTLIVPAVAFAKFLEYSAWWNLSVVVSILEEPEENFEAFSTASELSKGNRLRGVALMLLHSVWSFGLPTLLARWTFPSVIAYDFLDTSIIFLGTVMNWVAITVYYHDCKTHHKRLP